MTKHAILTYPKKFSRGVVAQMCNVTAWVYAEGKIHRVRFDENFTVVQEQEATEKERKDADEANDERLQSRKRPRQPTANSEPPQTDPEDPVDLDEIIREEVTSLLTGESDDPVTATDDPSKQREAKTNLQILASTRAVNAAKKKATRQRRYANWDVFATGIQKLVVDGGGPIVLDLGELEAKFKAAQVQDRGQVVMIAIREAVLASFIRMVGVDDAARVQKWWATLTEPLTDEKALELAMLNLKTTREALYLGFLFGASATIGCTSRFLCLLHYAVAQSAHYRNLDELHKEVIGDDDGIRSKVCDSLGYDQIIESLRRPFHQPVQDDEPKLVTTGITFSLFAAKATGEILPREEGVTTKEVAERYWSRASTAVVMKDMVHTWGPEEADVKRRRNGSIRTLEPTKKDAARVVPLSTDYLQKAIDGELTSVVFTSGSVARDAALDAVSSYRQLDVTAVIIALVNLVRWCCGDSIIKCPLGLKKSDCRLLFVGDDSASLVIGGNPHFCKASRLHIYVADFLALLANKQKGTFITSEESSWKAHGICEGCKFESLGDGKVGLKKANGDFVRDENGREIWIFLSYDKDEQRVKIRKLDGTVVNASTAFHYK